MFFFSHYCLYCLLVDVFPSVRIHKLLLIKLHYSFLTMFDRATISMISKYNITDTCICNFEMSITRIFEIYLVSIYMYLNLKLFCRDCPCGSICNDGSCEAGMSSSYINTRNCLILIFIKLLEEWPL